MYFAQSQKNIRHGDVFKWNVVGRPDREEGPANLLLVLQLDCVQLPGGETGLALGSETRIPSGVRLETYAAQILYANPMDEGGRSVWPVKGNGIEITFEGDSFFLVKPEVVIPDVGARVYFDILPSEYGEGNVIYFGDLHYEHYE